MRRLRPNRRGRGQTLVLFAMTLLMLTLMVCMTLSFGTKAKEKMELQQVADQAAYSTSVAVARGMNVLSSANRTMIAFYVAMLGLNSSSSFASLSLGIIEGQLLYYAIDEAFQAGYCASLFSSWCGCPGLAGVTLRLFLAIAEMTRIYGVMSSLDPLVASSARGASVAVMWLYAGQWETMFGQMFGGAVDGEKMSKRVMQGSTSAPEWKVNSAASSVAEREVGKVPFVDGALNVTNILASDRHAVWAAMASRGSPWTAGRLDPLSQGPMILTSWATARLNGDPLPIVSDGSAYFGAEFHTNVMWSSSSRAAVADDHAIFNAKFIGFQCAPPIPFLPEIAVSFVWSENTMSGPAPHAAGLGIFLPIIGPPDVPNTLVMVLVPVYGDPIHNVLGICAFNCPSAWSNFADYNLLKVASGSDNFAQPKIPVTVTRDLTQRANADPWNLLFNFRFAQTSTGQTLDLNDKNGIILSDGTDISNQTALSTGIVYYHRQGHWAEPPNLLSPFWRAGLTRADIDDQARTGGDIQTVLNNSGAPWAADAYNNLIAAGWRGLQ